MNSFPGLLVPIALVCAGLAIRAWLQRRRDLTLAGATPVEAVREEMDPEIKLLSSWPDVPQDVHDSAAWDRYWAAISAQRTFLAMEVMFTEMFADKRALVHLMREANLSSVLCVGNGVSREPQALARAGLAVDVLDLSAEAINAAQRIALNDEPTAGAGDDVEDIPAGRLTYHVGNLLDPTISPGPFDVIIERRTLQLFGDEKARAIEALGARLGARGLLLSHCHNGGWRPEHPRTHFNEESFRSNGWTIRHSQPSAKDLEGRVAWLMLSTG